MTFLPPAAPMVVPLRAALGAIEPWEIVLSIALMLAGDLDPVRGRGAGLRGRRAPGRQPDPHPGRLARPELTAPSPRAAWTSAQRKHATSWSFTRPADCISA